MKKCIKKLKNGKYDGTGLCTDVIKRIDEPLTKYMTEMFNNSIKGNIFPENLKRVS